MAVRDQLGGGTRHPNVLTRPEKGKEQGDVEEVRRIREKMERGDILCHVQYWRQAVLAQAPVPETGDSDQGCMLQHAGRDGYRVGYF